MTEARLYGFTRKELNAFFRHDAKRGYLYWKETQPNGVQAGERAGGADTVTGYWKVRFQGVPMYAHRIIFFLQKGYPPVEIDHKNRNVKGNRCRNLRNATHSENCRNKKKSKNNTSGFKGVWFHRTSSLWCAEIKLNYKKVYVGYFRTKKKAALAYNAAAKKYHGRFARLNRV